MINPLSVARIGIGNDPINLALLGFGGSAQMFASLGGVRTEAKRTKRKQTDEIESPFPESVISRIGNELLAGVMADDVIDRARKRKARTEEEAFLLMI